MEFRIKEAREKAGYSQKELAQIIGVAQNTFHGYESGKHDPKSDLLIKIAQACNTTTDFLLGYEHYRAIHSLETKIAPSYSDEALRLAVDYDWLDGHGKQMLRLVADEEKARLNEERVKARASPQPQQDHPEPDKVVYITKWFSMPMSAGTGLEAGSDDPEELELTKRPPRGTSYVAPVRGDSMEPTYHDGDKLFIRPCEEIEPGQTGVFLMDGKQWVKELGDGVLISHNPDYAPIPMRDDIECQGLVLGVCDESYFEK